MKIWFVRDQYSVWDNKIYTTKTKAKEVRKKLVESHISTRSGKSILSQKQLYGQWYWIEEGELK